MKRTLIGLAFLAVLMVGCTQEQTFLGEWQFRGDDIAIDLTIETLCSTVD